MATRMCPVIGQNGNNFKKAKALPGVHDVLVQRDDSIIIFADQREQAEAAKELLEIVIEEMGVESNEVGFIIGKGGEQIRELQQMSQCRIDVLRDSNCVKIAGTRAAVNKVY